MTRTDTLTNRNMFLIGRIALDKEHLHLWQLIYQLRHMSRAPTLHGRVNDCLYIRPMEESEEELVVRVANLIHVQQKMALLQERRSKVQIRTD